MLHDEHRDPDDVVAFLCRWLLIDDKRARQSMKFCPRRWGPTPAPTWRGYRLLRGWFDARPDGGAHRTVRVVARRAADPVVAARAEVAGLPEKHHFACGPMTSDCPASPRGPRPRIVARTSAIGRLLLGA